MLQKLPILNLLKHHGNIAMKRLIFYLVVLLLAVWLGLKVAANQGYVVLAYQHWTIQSPLWVAGLVILLIFIALYIVFRTIGGAQSFIVTYQNWSKQRSIRRGWQRTQRGLIAHSAGEWRLAEKELLRGINQDETAIINYLTSARSAQSQGDIEKRDEHLRHIQPKDKLSEIALGITQAELQLEHNQLEQSLATLQRLQHMAPKHVHTLLLLQTVYLKLNDWTALETLLPSLRKYKVYPPEEINKLEITVYQGLLETAAKNGKPDSLHAIWERMSRDLRQQPQLIIIYVREIAKENPTTAEQLLRNALQKQWDNSLIYWYGLIIGKDHDKQLKTAESWLKDQPNNAQLLLALGRLSMANKLWGKAKSYFESSLTIAPTPETYAEFAALLEQLGETDSALQKYRSGLALANKTAKDIA